MYLDKTNLYYICILKTTKHKISNYICPKTKIIINNEGSHTRVIQYSKCKETNIKILQRQNITNKREQKQIRYVWLATSTFTKLTFARSVWNISNNNKSLKILKHKTPIGQFFIRNKLDINKEMLEFLVFYCKDLEKKLGFKGEFWGRKYILQQKKHYQTIIQEFFSPNSILFN